MAIYYKTEAEIEKMREGGKRLRKVVEELKPLVREGVTTAQIDKKAEELIKKVGGESSFKTVDNYFWSTCLSINDQIVHTPPSKRILKEGDILKLDIGLFYQGFHTDYADSIVVGSVHDEKRKFLQVGRNALKKGIEKIKIGDFLGKVSETIEEEIRRNRYSIVKELTGHGIGTELHEDPYVLNYLDKPIEKTLRIQKGLTVALEPIYTMGDPKMEHEEKDGWSIRTVDRSLAGHFEHTVAVTHEGETVILT